MQFLEPESELVQYRQIRAWMLSSLIGYHKHLIESNQDSHKQVLYQILIARLKKLPFNVNFLTKVDSDLDLVFDACNWMQTQLDYNDIHIFQNIIILSPAMHH